MSMFAKYSNTAFNQHDLFVRNLGDSTAETFTGLTSSTGGPLDAHQERTFSSFTFQANGLTYSYVGQWTIEADQSLLSGTVSARGFYDRIEVRSGNQIVATYDGPAKQVDFGTVSGAGVLGLLSNVVNAATTLLFGPSDGTRAFANLHYDATPTLESDSFAADDSFFGGSGNDVLTGFAGNDSFFGGLGADAMNGGAGLDYARYDYAATGVVASLVAPATNTGEAAGDTYVGIEGLVGSNFGDTLTGDAGNNILIGRGGSDTLTGGGGNDVFMNIAADWSNDTITDFSLGDTIVIQNSLQAAALHGRAAGTTLTLAGGEVINLTGLGGKNGHVSAVESGGNTYVSLIQSAHDDTSGDGRGDIQFVNTDGRFATWTMNGFSVVDTGVTPMGPTWKVAGTGDFNFDGRADTCGRTTVGKRSSGP